MVVRGRIERPLVAFRETARALDGDASGRYGIWVVLGSCSLVGMLLVLNFGTVGVFVVSSRARVEAVDPVRHVQSEVAGRVIENRVQLGQEVRSGDTLLELDASLFGERLGVIDAELDGATHELETIRREQAAVESAVIVRSQQGALEWSAATTETERVTVEAKRAREEADVALRLFETGVGPAYEADEFEATARALELGVVGAGQRAKLSGSKRTLAQAEGDVEVARLDTRAVQLQAEIDRLRRERKVLEGEVTQHVIVAPINGRIGSGSTVQRGSFVAQGQEVAAVIPDAGVHVVAWFEPDGESGRLKVGQTVRVRVDGFPWAQYGVIEGVIIRCSDEPVEGLLRVEIEMSEAQSHAIPVRHNMAGVVEVEVERVTIGAMLARQVLGALDTDPRVSEVPEL